MVPGSYILRRSASDDTLSDTRRASRGREARIETSSDGASEGNGLSARLMAYAAAFMAEGDQMGHLWKQGFFEGSDPQ